MYHTLVLVYGIELDKKPRYLSGKLNCDINRQTRFATSGGFRRVERSQSSLSQAAFQVRAAQLWNDLPTDIRSFSTVVSFKEKLKEWVKRNISINP